MEKRDASDLRKIAKSDMFTNAEYLCHGYNADVLANQIVVYAVPFRVFLKT